MAQFKVSEIVDRIQPGDKVRLYDTSESPSKTVTGVVAEKKGRKFYIHQNEHKGTVGAVKPFRTGFKYSWMVGTSNKRQGLMIEVLEVGNGSVKLRALLPKSIARVLRKSGQDASLREALGAVVNWVRNRS